MLNEALLKVTLTVILDGQATLYALIQDDEENMEYHIQEYKKQTANLIVEAMGEAQNVN